MSIETIARRSLVLTLLVFFCVQAGGSASTKSATWDETPNFGLGRYLLEHFRWDVPGSILHPPLSFYLQGLPLLFCQLDERVWNYRNDSPRSAVFLATVDIHRGQTLLSSPGNRDDRLLMLSRSMSIAMGVLLGLVVYLFGRSLFGWKAGILSLALFASCPNMLAHAGLVTPDMTLTLFFFLAIYRLHLALTHKALRQYLLAGIVLGLALLSKFTALLLIPLAALLIAILLLTGRVIRPACILVLFGSALFVLLLGYGFTLTPYLQGIAFQLSHASQGHSAFLMGEHSTTGWWYYFLVAFFIKTPLPVLFLLATALLVFSKDVAQRTVRMDDLFLIVPASLVFAFFSVRHQSVGLRYVLPAYPFIFVLAGGVAARVRWMRYLLPVLILWHAMSSVSTHPHYLAYFNEIVGGPPNGYRYLVDSNLDWGQDLKGLKAYMDRNGIERLYLSYFGSDSPERYGIRYDWLPSYRLRNPAPGQGVRLPVRGYVAVSATNLQGVYLDPKNMYAPLAATEPVARIGHSIFVYYVQ